MGFGEAVRSVLSKYATFSGRAPRSEYWWWWLFYLILLLVAGILDSSLGLAEKPGQGPIGGILALGLLLPNIAVAARRLHDLDRSGWWLLIGFIPIIGWLVLLYWYVQPGTPEENRFGPDPLAAMPDLGETAPPTT